MARVRSVDFLPEIFQTSANTKFLNSTLDQLIQEPKLKQTQGYVGRKSAPGKLPTDGYIPEQTDVRSNYQLEPGVIFKDENGETVDALTYMGLLDGLKTEGSNVDDHNRLFTSESYSWSPYIEFDKVVNYSQYFWLPNGPDNVAVSSTDVLFADDFDIAPGTDSVEIEGFTQTNPVLTLIRGGTYNFNVSQDGHPFYIQTHSGVDGTVPWASNISSRDILGVTNNGDDNGVVNFQVPLADAQIEFHNLTDIGNVDIATEERMDAIADETLATVQANFAALQDIENKTIVFLRTDELGWTNDSLPVTTLADRYQIYRIQIEDVLGTDYVRLIPIQPIAIAEKFTILYGTTYSNISFYKTTDGVFVQIPLETASLDVLYYQDATDPNRVGVINLIDLGEEAIIDVDNILDRATYTSPTGVVFTNGLKVQFRGAVTPAEYINNEYYVEGVGTAIKLILVTDLIVPEDYATGLAEPWDINPWDSTGFGASSNLPADQDYLTINRSSLDLNAWSRSNRWFHYDVLVATADYNGVVLELDNDTRALRPIIEFDANMHLFNYGTVGKHVVHIIDFTTTDAMSTVNGAEIGSAEATIDGFKLGEGTLVIFAADTDLTVRNKVYIVEAIDPDGPNIPGDPPTNPSVVNLVPIVDGGSEVDDITLIAAGLELQGTVYKFDGDSWIESQAKTAVNQAPLFDIFDTAGNSLSETASYTDTTFVGSKVFSYADGTGTIDSVLGFPLRYLNIDNLGDIVFQNNLYTDTFSYVLDTVAITDASITSGFARKYFTRTEYTNELGWVTSVEDTRQSQNFETVYDGEPIVLDILPATNLQIPSVRITANGVFVTPDKYTVVDNVITFLATLETDSELLVAVYSDEISEVGFYNIPSNLSSNMFNENTSQLTLGTIRNHYNRLSENIVNIDGNINGANNLRDLGDISKFGTLIVQQSAPIALAAMFMRNREYNFFSATEFASRQYEKFKNQITNWVEKHDLTDLSVSEILDTAIKDINIGKTINSAFYWSDMLPTGSDFESTEHIITAITTPSFTTLNTYDFLSANTKALLVYHNDTLLIKDTDYTVATDGPRITLLITPVVDDTITITEYDTTLGANVPSTPTKLGLFAKYVPTMFTDDTYVTPVDVIQGHDGSITAAFGDVRDDVIMEFEKRVYNNLKVTEELPIELADIIPGAFRNTDYTGEEVTAILTPSLLSWLGWNRIDYKSQDYNAAEAKTWNYSSTTEKITGDDNTRANWRGIYIRFYDTDAPHIRPWEMVGLTERPDWWNTRYGVTPYTSGNLVLWDDMEAGLVMEPGNEHVDERFKRPGLTTVLPVDSEGNLVMPLDSVVASYTSNDFKKSWTIGDMAPAEAAWMKSSAWPFAVQRLYALTKPAQYFALMADRDRYKYDEVVGQYLYDERYRLDVRDIELQDDNLVKHSYINWILDYNKHYGYDSSEKLVTDLSNLDVNLCYHMASFTDKNNLKIFTDKSSPDSTNSSLLLPDESFNLLLYKNQTIAEIIYSSVIVQKAENGYTVTGNSTTDPYFQIQTPLATGHFTTATVGRTAATSTTVQVPQEFEDTSEFIPYSHIFSSKQAVSVFLISYGEFLRRSGLKFTAVEDTLEVSWGQMVQEFLYWADQGWAINSIINLNPSATAIEFERELTIVDDLNNLELTEQPQNQNGDPLDISDYVVDRIDNNFKIKMIDDNIIAYLKFNLTSFEHLLILDNVSIFNDLIYDPVTGIRQQRVKLSGFTTFEWNGQLDAQGFLYNEDNVKEWTGVNRYNKGDIVKFKNAYWSAAEKIQPTETFDFSQWVKTDYDKINKGLLPNLATKSDQMLQYYNNKTANLESDIDLMAYGLTGFRSRDYLRGLDLDDISQVNIYRNLIETKGTPQSLTLFKDVTLNNETVDYTIFENWALKRASYGATSSRSHIDLQLDGSLLVASPSLIEIIDGPITADNRNINVDNDIITADGWVGDINDLVADQLILVDDIYGQSEKNTNKNIFTTLDERNPDTALPTAGFVKAEDVDIAVFEISDIVSTVVDGTLTWVAKDTEVDWNVYRATTIDAIILSVNDNLDGTLTLVTDIAHNLTGGVTITVADTDILVDGTYKILEVSDSVNIVIAGELATDQTCILDLAGVILEFITARVGVPSDIADTIFNGVDAATDTVWVSDVNNKAAVYEKTAPYVLTDAEENPANTDTDFGQSIAQGYNDTGMLVGDPTSGTGIAHFYNKTDDGYTYDQALVSTANPTVANYGAAVTFIEEWGAIAAPGNGSTPGEVIIVQRDIDLLTITETQKLTKPATANDDTYGTSVAMSKDENWLYVGEPLNNEIHAYQNVSGVFTWVATIAGATFGAAGSDLFGAAIDTSTDGKHIIIGAPGTATSTGKTYMVSEVAPADYKLIQEISAVTPVVGATFGNAVAICKSKCSVYIGAENDLAEQGTVTHYINSSRLAGILTSTLANPVIASPGTIRINNVEVAFLINATSQDIADAINTAEIPNVDASALNGFLTIQLTNKVVRVNEDRLEILAGDNVSLATLGLAPYEIAQTITSPVTTTTAQYFGSSVSLDLDLNQLAVGTPNGIGQDVSTSADGDLITVDNDVISVDAYGNTGVVYVYDVLPGADANTSGKLVLGQEIYATDMYTGDQFGAVINLVNGMLVAGSVNYDTDATNVGRVVIFDNVLNSDCWIATSTQNDIVDIDLVNSLYIYDTDSLAALRYLDYIDPLNGKLLGAASQNIDFIAPFDPTVYEGANAGLLWGAAQVGLMWWNISNVRFQDYTIGDATHSSKVWGKIFPGATVDILQWVESDALPVDYTGTGTVMDEDTYITVESVNRSNLTKNTYYYWVNKVESISVNSEKTLSASAISSYIEAPASSGISYAAIIAPNLVGLYNCKDVINDMDSILHIEYSKVANENNVFVEYDLFRENHPSDFLSDSLYKKLQDSMCGIDTEGQAVPATNLSPVERYGIDFRPRQTMFIDRYAAIESYLKKVNGILAEHTITESSSYPLLNSEEALPPISSGEWDQQLADSEELSFQDFAADGIGYRYLVESDSANDGLWAIYEVTASLTLATLQLNRVQTYDTNRYWSTEHWYATDFSPFTKVDYVVNEFTELTTLGDVENNAIAKVIHNSIGSWEIYQLIDGEWIRQALENGTIQLDSKLWTAGELSVQATELRQVINSVNEELLVGDLAVERSQAILSIFNYILAEQPNVNWLYKTSLIDVTQKVRGLSQYAVYQKDNQDYLIEYIKEAKPYHTKVKDFSLSYDGFDYINGDVTDFDCPSTYSTEFEQYISPILDDGAILVTDPSNAKPDDPIWTQTPWTQWFENYSLTINGIVITSPGSGYTIAPEVVVTGDNTTPAELTARLGLGGAIVEINIINGGAGYLAPPVITFVGSDGSGAAASAIMDNTLVRTFLTTVKYDRYEYQSKVALFDENDVTTTRNLVFKYSGSNQDTFDGYFIVGSEYEITKVGTTDFTALGAATNTTGTIFTATGTGAIGDLTLVGKAVEIPVLYRVTELYGDGDDNTVFDPTKFEAVPYFTTAAGLKIYAGTTADATIITVDNDTVTVDASTGLDAIEIKYFKEGVASWYEEDDEFGVPTGVWVNENDNSESRNFVRYNNKTYNMITFTDTSVFSSIKYTEVDIEALGGIDRTTGHYVSDVNNPGLDLSLLFDGIAYPGVEVSGDTYTVTEEELDVIYESDYTDTYLGTRPTDINIEGGEFIDTYHSHAPEELMPGSIFDTLDIQVYARPGSDYLSDGHAFAIHGTVYETFTTPETFSFADLSAHPISILVANVTTGEMLYEDTGDFTVLWETQEVIINNGISIGDNVKIFVYEVGGGNQLHRDALLGSELTTYITCDSTAITCDATNITADTSSGISVPVNNDEIDSVLVFVNGLETTVKTQPVDNYTALVILPTAPAANAFITVTVFGVSAGGYEESYPEINTWTEGVDTPADVGTQIDGKSRHNAIVEVNGLRLRPPEAARTIADGISNEFLFPTTGGYTQDSVSSNEVDVYVNDTLLNPNTEFVNSPTGTGDTRYVILNDTPLVGDVVDVYINREAEYSYSGTELVFDPVLIGGATIAITTFRDVRELDMLTQVFQGATILSEVQIDTFESFGFDVQAFDFELGVNTSVNIFTMDTIITNKNRLWVTLNGERLHAGSGYSIVNDNQIVLFVPTIQPTDVVAITSLTDNVITAGATFRLFKDMRDTVGMYKMLSSSTYLTANLNEADDIIYVADASVLGSPNLATAVFGIIIINGERITYRERDLTNNTVSGLRRGTAGTGFAVIHALDSTVTDVSRKSLVQWNYDKIWYEQGATTASNGTPLQDQTTTPASFIKT